MRHQYEGSILREFHWSRGWGCSFDEMIEELTVIGVVAIIPEEVEQ